MLYTRRPNRAQILPDLCKHDLPPPLGISHVYTNIDGAHKASGRVFAVRTVFSVPVPPPLSSPTAVGGVAHFVSTPEVP